MRIVFMGTPEFASTALGALLDGQHEVAAVYTRAPKRSGRGKREKRSPVHELADIHGIPVKTPKSFRSEEAVDEFLSVGADVGIVVAYGLILPQVILDGPKLGCFNLHASLLPRWRGAAPIQRSIMAGDTLTGVQVMRMERGLDTGPILLSATTPIAATDTAGTLHDRLAQTGAQILPQFLAALDRGTISETPQSEEGVTYAEKITIDEARIDWSKPAPIVDQMIRGLSPAPGAFFETDSPASGRTRIKVLMSRVCDGSSGVDTSASPGTVIRAKGVLTVACGQGAVDLIRLQRSGKTAQEADVFLRGFPIAEGATLCRP